MRHVRKLCQKQLLPFLESRDFEDAIRNAVSLGGDTDTLGAITGSIAEAVLWNSSSVDCRV